MSGESFVFFFVHFSRDDFRNLAFFCTTSHCLQVLKKSLWLAIMMMRRGTAPHQRLWIFVCSTLARENFSSVCTRWSASWKGNRNEGPRQVIFMPDLSPQPWPHLFRSLIGVSSVPTGPGGVRRFKSLGYKAKQSGWSVERGCLYLLMTDWAECSKAELSALLLLSLKHFALARLTLFIWLLFTIRSTQRNHKKIRKPRDAVYLFACNRGLLTVIGPSRAVTYGSP